MAQQTLTYDHAAVGTTVIKNVSFQIKSAGIFELVGKDGKVIQTLKLTGKGSDGMSDTIYPYDVQDTTIGGGAANSGFGGCSSNYLKTKKGSN